MAGRKGKGALGLRSGLPDYELLSNHSASIKHGAVSLRPVTTVETQWNIDQTGTYETPYELTDYRGFREDVVGVKSLLDTGLTRVETRALCRSTAGTFFYDVDEDFDQSTVRWDDGVGKWQLETVTLDGATYMLFGGNMDGVTDGTGGIFSAWLKIDELPSASEIFLNSTSARFTTTVNTSGQFILQLRNAANTVILNMRTSALSLGVFHHVCASWSMVATPVTEMFLDGVSDKTITVGPTAGTVDYTTGNWSFGSYVTAGNYFNGHVGAIYLNTDEANSGDLPDKFRNAATGEPEDIGHDGSGATGNQPAVWMDNGADRMDLNRGYGGEWGSTVGTFTDHGYTAPNNTARLKWDQFPLLYVHLEDGSDPDETEIVIQHEVQYANHGNIYPALGENQLINGGLENWSGGEPNGWTVSTGGDAVISEETSDVREGLSAMKCAFDGTETNRWQFIGRTMTTTPVNNAVYRLAGSYKTVETSKGVAQVTASIKAQDSVTTEAIEEDGRTLSTNLIMPLDNTGGEWRRFCIDFTNENFANAWRVELFGGSAVGGVGHVLFDDISWQRVYRYYYHEPRLSASSLPTIDTGSNDIYFGGKRISSGGITLNNSDGGLDTIFGRLEWMNQDTVVRTGGELLHADGSKRLPFDDWEHRFTGLIQRIESNDAETSVELFDLRTFFHIDLPKKVYDDTTFLNMDTRRFTGKPRPYFFGIKENITPARIDYDVTNSKYGKYEIADCTLWGGTGAGKGIKGITKIYAYESETAATELDTSKRIELDSADEPTVWTQDLENGQFRVNQDVGPYIIDETNNKLDLDGTADASGTEVTVSLTAGIYTAATLASHVQAALIAQAGGAGWTCTYSDTTNKFNIVRTVAFSLWCKKGANKEITAYKLLGYELGSDKTGWLSSGDGYIGEQTTFDNVDRDHILRVDAQGYKDDTAGTYTGIATTQPLIQAGPDICMFIFHVFMKKSLSKVDTTSFTAARSLAGQSLSLYMNKTVSTKDIFDRLEYSNIANIVVDGAGNISYKVYDGTVPANVLTLGDTDFAEFSVERSVSDIYRAIRVQFDQDPSNGNFKERESSDDSVEVRLGRPDIRTFHTYLKIGDNAISVSGRMLELAKSAARKVRASVVNPQVIRLDVGSKVRVSRSRAMGLTGALTNDVFRIISIRKDPMTAESEIEAVDDRVTVASNACLTDCQSFCESTCQAACEQGCQTPCQASCQAGCEVGCQEICQTACQEFCEVNCQTTCELNCQTTCEQVCQGACEGGGCQTTCEYSCQTTCEVACQSTCQLGGCQTVCQQGCETTCEQACQTGCEVSCQTACEGSCQDTCELNCQSTCELYCQAACEAECQTVEETNPLP